MSMLLIQSFYFKQDIQCPRSLTNRRSFSLLATVLVLSEKMTFTVHTFWICTRYWSGLNTAGSEGLTPNTYGESSMFLGFVSFSISNNQASKNSPAPSISQQHNFCQYFQLLFTPVYFTSIILALACYLEHLLAPNIHIPTNCH